MFDLKPASFSQPSKVQGNNSSMLDCSSKYQVLEAGTIFFLRKFKRVYFHWTYLIRLKKVEVI